MRLGFAVPASLAAVLMAAAVPAAAAAAPAHNHGLTINATPSQIVTGDPVLIYGQLNRPVRGNQVIRLYHRVNPNRGFTFVQQSRTNALGFYEFTRAQGVVTTNRNWFVTGPSGTHSRTVHEEVEAALTLSPSNPTSGETNHPLTFTGSIQPAGHAGERVVLQQLAGDNGDAWRTIASSAIDSGSGFTLTHRFIDAGNHELRVLFRGDARNVRTVSDNFTVSIQQTQNPAFTINTSAQIVSDGTPVTISGVLYKPGSSSTPEPATSVTLWARPFNGSFAPVTSVPTGTDGSYSFTETPAHNTVYEVRTTFAPKRHTAQLFEGVRDVVSLTSSSLTSTVGGKVTLSGTVSPDKAGHAIYLERLGADGDYHVVKVGRIDASSAYSFGWTFSSPGSKTFRVRVPGGDANVGASSAPVTITVSLPAVQSLPPAS